ncbi:MAG: tRNA modification GTPase [Phycisphaerae bacterium]|nr:tRNA modification GTPase [Phycisphaerae bacterium]
MNLEDTIVAVSSPPGSCLRGIVRLSGPDSASIADCFFHPDNHESLSAVIESSERPAAVFGNLHIEHGSLPAMAFLFRSPRSYTGQNIVEIHCVGSPVVLGLMVVGAFESGARLAEPGEFTARAFFAGKLDLSQVHAVAGMIAARSDAQLAAAEQLLHGALSRRAIEARDELADLLSLVEGAMDFADEPIEFISASELAERLSRLYRMLSSTIAAGERAERWGRLPSVVLTGRPNAGKSSLLNRLTGTERSICAPIPGTTRDAVSSPMSLGGLECLLVDIAGHGAPVDALDAQAQRVALDAVEGADLIVEVVDASVVQGAIGMDSIGGDPTTEDCHLPNPAIPRLRVANKVDLLDERGMSALRRCTQAGRGLLPVSALTGDGVDELKEQIKVAIEGRSEDRRDSAIALMAEHRESLERAVDALERAVGLAKIQANRLSDADLIATELRIAADELGTLVGKDQTEDMLGRIFSRFCVGK